MIPQKIKGFDPRVTQGDGFPELFLSLTRVEKFGESVTKRHLHPDIEQFVAAIRAGIRAGMTADEIIAAIRVGIESVTP